MFKRKRQSCDIHGKYSGETCEFCAMGNRMDAMTRNMVADENIQLKKRIQELEAQLERVKALPERWEQQDCFRRCNSRCANDLRKALAGDDDEILGN